MAGLHSRLTLQDCNLFPDAYQNGIPLGTESEWGWHSFVDTADYKFEESLKDYDVDGRKVSYSVQMNEPARTKNAVNWFRQNVHRLQLGNLGLEIKMKNGKLATIDDIKNIHQSLNMWTGEIHSQFTVENIPVDVITFCRQAKDAVAVKIESALIIENRLSVRVRLPYPTGNFLDEGNDWSHENFHQSSLHETSYQSAVITHSLDTTNYQLNLTWKGIADISEKSKHYFLLKPSSENSFEFSCEFASTGKYFDYPSFDKIKNENINTWKTFWTKGAFVDFSGSTDERAAELQRRIILSQYLTKIQCGGNMPPQETGLTYNSWYGKPHLEMHWWHGVHYALWNHIDILEKQMAWYKKVFDKAKGIAARQGYSGARWQKMTDPEGNESPSSVGSFLIWQQPHFITFAELCYREHSNKTTIDKYKELVFATADFMASYAHYDSVFKRYVLGKRLIPAQEVFKQDETFNPTYELSYWQWALSTAQQWRLRSGLSRNKKWDDVLNKLSPLPKQNGMYLATESATDSYTNPKYKTDHPAVLGAYGMLPYNKMLDTAIMKNTFDWVMQNWDWKTTWGWDYPMVAMTATRLNMPEKAMDALMMNVQKNTYLSDGHNYQDERLRLYLPGNGGLLTAIAVMCAGYDGATVANPGIPKNGKWKVKWEGLRKLF